MEKLSQILLTNDHFVRETILLPRLEEILLDDNAILDEPAVLVDGRKANRQLSFPPRFPVDGHPVENFLGISAAEAINVSAANGAHHLSAVSLGLAQRLVGHRA